MEYEAPKGQWSEVEDRNGVKLSRNTFSSTRMVCMGKGSLELVSDLTVGSLQIGCSRTHLTPPTSPPHSSSLVELCSTHLRSYSKIWCQVSADDQQERRPSCTNMDLPPLPFKKTLAPPSSNNPPSLLICGGYDATPPKQNPFRDLRALIGEIAFWIRQPHNHDANDCETCVHFCCLLDHAITLIRHNRKIST